VHPDEHLLLLLLLLQVLYDVWCIAFSAGVGPRRKPRTGSDEVSSMGGGVLQVDAFTAEQYSPQYAAAAARPA
jgi:hypothetical protein